MDFFVSLLPQIPNLILLVVAALTLVFLVVFARKYQASQKGLGEAIKGLESKLGNHNGRDPRDLDPIFAKQPLLHIWNEYSDRGHIEQMLKKFRITDFELDEFLIVSI